MSAGDVIALQQTAGNASVVRLLARAGQRSAPPILPRRGASRRTAPIVQRDEESAKALTSMAEPKVGPGPEVRLQQSLVDALEGRITELASKKNEGFNQDNLFLGGIELTSIPAEPEKDEELVKGSTLIRMRVNSLGRDDYDLVEDLDKASDSAVSRMIVTNTLKTMIAAHQIDYLRKSGFVGKGWKVLVEVHYYRRRSKASHQLHKDTLGQTLFVNLNYHTKEAIAGPEYIVNPPPQEKHDDFTKEGGKIRSGPGTDSYKDLQLTGGGLPPTFREDVAAARTELTKSRAEGDQPTVHAPTIPAYGYLAFVDELIHHNTPMIGHRQISPGTLKLWLTKRYGDEYKRASQAWEKWSGRYFFNKGYDFASYLPKDVPNREMWLELIPMALGTGLEGKKYSRPDLLKAHLPDKEVDQLLYDQGPSEYSRVSLPTVLKGIPQSLGLETTRPPLKRQMSQLALEDKMPADTVGDTRCFFRTWVRAVKTETV